MDCRSARLSSALPFPPFDLRPVSGFAHICAVVASPCSGSLHSILLNGSQPRSEDDTLLLCAARARSSVLINSVRTVAGEGGAAPGWSLCGPLAEAALSAWRAEDLGLRAGGVHLLLTRGGRELDGALPMFSPSALFSAVVGVPRGAPPLRWRPGVPAPAPTLPLASSALPDVAVGEALAAARSALAAGGHPWGAGAAGRPDAAEPLVLVEAGAALTRALYEGAECPLDWLIVSEYRGGGLTRRAWGAS